MPAAKGNRHSAKPGHLRKRKVITIRASDAQKEKLETLSKAVGMNKSEWVIAKIEESAQCKLIAGIEIDEEQ